MAQSTTIINGKGLITSIGGTAIAGSLASVTLTIIIENSQFYTADGDLPPPWLARNSGAV